MNIKDKILYFFKGSFVSKLFGFATFFLFAKAVSLEVFAVYTIFLFTSEILSISLTHGFNSYILRNSNKSVRDDLFPKTIFIIICSFLIFSISIYLSKSIFLEYLPSSYLVIFNSFTVVITIIFSQSIIKMIYGYLISNHLAKEHMQISVMHGFLKLSAALIIFYVLNISSLNLILYSLLISNIVTLIFCFILIKNFITLKFVGFKESMSLIYDASPFMLKMVIGTFGLYLSRVILDGMATKEELAVYSFYLMIIFQLNFFTTIISQSVMPSIRDNFDKLDVLKLNLNRYLKKYYTFSSILLVAIIASSYVISNTNIEILNVFIREEYLESIWLFSILILSYFISAPRTIYDVWQYHELMDVKLKLFAISTSNVIAGVIAYPIGYAIGNIYGVAIGYVIITSVFTYVSLHFFRNLIRMIEREKHIHNS
jgi:O-antigen/teichoic acid export membrane protein